MHTCYLSSYKKEFKSFIAQNKKATATTVIQIYPSELYTNSNSIVWEDENKEVFYKGVLYDVIHIENKNGKVLLTAVSDFQETILKKQFASIYDINSEPSTKNPFELLKHFLTLKTIVHNPIRALHLFPISSFSFLNYFSFRLSAIALNQVSPPPDFFA